MLVERPSGQLFQADRLWQRFVPGPLREPALQASPKSEGSDSSDHDGIPPPELPPNDPGLLCATGVLLRVARVDETDRTSRDTIVRIQQVLDV
jgi:hypothetical protein